MTTGDSPIGSNNQHRLSDQVSTNTDQCKVAALRAAVALVALDPRGAAAMLSRVGGGTSGVDHEPPTGSPDPLLCVFKGGPH